MRSKKNENSINKKVYGDEGFFKKLGKFIYYKFQDVRVMLKYGRKFKEYGVTLYVGEQGSGKSIAVTEELERLRKLYPKALIITNYGYVHQTQEFTDWKDFFDIRNGEDGVIFAIDEIQNEFNSKAWKEFPEELLSEITQQRKQKVKILATAQVWEDVVVQLRRQTLFVCECSTIAERWTFVRCYKKRVYNRAMQLAEGTENRKIPYLWKRSFIQDENIRDLYDTEKKIERLKRTEFMSRKERAV